MGRMASSVSPKGQVTIPAEIRQLLGIKPRDRVVFRVDGGVVTIAPVRSALGRHYQSVPALDPPRTIEEMTEIAWEEHARAVAREGM